MPAVFVIFSRYEYCYLKMTYKYYIHDRRILTVCRFSFDATTSVVSVGLSMNVRITIVQNPFNMANARFVIRMSFRYRLVLIS
jgi:hypothetical protein